jgi:CheY-like chemotaxis protein
VALVHSDPVLLESILRNLLSNAVRYTAQGKVTLSCEARGSFVRVEVFDTGPGIPISERERIFEEFHRLGDAGNTERGLGLGLAIVRRLAELLGVGVELASEVGIGSVFSLTVPGANTAITMAESPVDTTNLLAGRCLLLVEDDVLVREALTREVVDWGAHPIVAASAEDALSLLAQPAQRQPDLAIVDRDLGGRIDGPALLGLLRERLHLEIPAIIVTGATDPAALTALRESGYLWVTKPIDAEVLQRIAGELLTDTTRQ